MIPSPSLHGQALAERFEDLSGLLKDARPLWTPRPFTGLPASWEGDLPELASWLRTLTDDQTDALEDLPALPPDAPGWESWAGRIATGVAVGEAQRVAVPGLDGPRLPLGIKGRKWAQIRAFAGVALASRGPRSERLVDWCAGKGHLGRTLSVVTGLPVLAVERQGPLCAAGAELARKAKAPCRFSEADVLRTPPPLELRHDALAVSLLTNMQVVVFDESLHDAWLRRRRIRP